MAHSATSVANPLKLGRLFGYMADYDRRTPLYDKNPNMSSWLVAIDNQHLWSLMTYITSELPLKAIAMAAKIRGDERK